jgi:GT2 family glycosyltransferase
MTSSEAHTPLVSVIMTVYNDERFVAEAIDSILGQSWTHFEFIVVDDASTDNTPAILRKYEDPRILILTGEKNLGPYGAANRGLAVARGALIARMDADDVSLPRRLELQVRRFQEQPSLVLLGTSFQYIDEQGRILDTAIMPTGNAELQERLEDGNLFAHSAVMVRREAMAAVGGYREFFPVSQDYDLYLRLAELGEIANLPEPLGLVRVHARSISRNKKELQLACRRLAWALAEQRRTTGVEGPIPEDVVAAFPPEPIRLLSDARGTAYLYYASDKPALAQEALTRAQQLLSQIPDRGSKIPDRGSQIPDRGSQIPDRGSQIPDRVGAGKTQSWEQWTLGLAAHHAELRNDPAAGVEFIRFVAACLGSDLAGGNVNRLLGRFYAEQAFLSHRAGESRRTREHAWHALRHDLTLARNRGLWAISARSLGPKMRKAA